MEQSVSSPKRSAKKKAKKIKNNFLEEGSSNELVIVDEIIPRVKSGGNKTPINASPTTSNNSSNNKKRKKRDSASSDEERWLTAIETGKLEDVDDELKKIKPKDPALMTARQRAMYDRGEGVAVSTPTLMSLPTGYKEKVMTAEAIQKAAIKSLKRKQLADEKREKDKKKTMERLLKKQDSKATKQTKPKIVRSHMPSILYKQNLDETILSMPEGYDFPLKPKKIEQYPKVKYCIMGCGNRKKYSCAKTGAALCSLNCYNENLSKMSII